MKWTAKRGLIFDIVKCLVWSVLVGGILVYLFGVFLYRVFYPWYLSLFNIHIFALVMWLMWLKLCSRIMYSLWPQNPYIKSVKAAYEKRALERKKKQG